MWRSVPTTFFPDLSVHKSTRALLYLKEATLWSSSGKYSNLYWNTSVHPYLFKLINIYVNNIWVYIQKIWRNPDSVRLPLANIQIYLQRTKLRYSSLRFLSALCQTQSFWSLLWLKAFPPDSELKKSLFSKRPIAELRVSALFRLLAISHKF